MNRTDRPIGTRDLKAEGQSACTATKLFGITGRSRIMRRVEYREARIVKHQTRMLTNFATRRERGQLAQKVAGADQQGMSASTEI